MIRLYSDAEHAALAHCIPAPRHIPDLRRRHNQVLIAHYLCYGCSHLWNKSQLNAGEFCLTGIVVENIFSDVGGILLAAFEGLSYGCGDAVIGVNPASDSVGIVSAILRALERLVEAYQVPTQTCCLAHITTQLAALENGVPVEKDANALSNITAAVMFPGNPNRKLM